MTTTEDSAIEGNLYLFGRRVLGLFPDMFERGITFPITELGGKEKEFADNFDLKAIEEFICSFQTYILEQKGKAKRKELSLALRIQGHDLNNLAGHIILSSESYLANKRLLFPEIFFKDYFNYRTLILAMADLGLSGKDEFVTELPISQLEYLLSMDRKDLSATYTSSDLSAINSREYVSLYQLVKNVPVPEAVNRKKVPISINITDLGKKRLLVVRDNGSGILDKEGNPISAERLPEIFGDYSTKKGGGLGLQLVKALVELPSPGKRKSELGYVSVSTKSEGESPLFYSTSDGISRTLESNFAPGTEFTLCFRH